mmetsp:Transcript_44549/g.48202  ORF Transcript_44549/g.48202 Transcript_44549/m.48202 type:complete len:88 (+) Transcript_44549:126-389(+)
MTCSMIMHNREEEEETDVGDAEACHGNRDNHSFNGHTSHLFIATSHRPLAFLPPRIYPTGHTFESCECHDGETGRYTTTTVVMMPQK